MASKSKISRRIDSLYIGKSTFLKVFLLCGVVVVSTFFIWYTFDVIGQLQTDTRAQAEKYVRLWQMTANSPTTGEALPFVFEEIILKFEQLFEHNKLKQLVQLITNHSGSTCEIWCLLCMRVVVD